MPNHISTSPSGPNLSQMAYGAWRLLDDGGDVQQLNRCVELDVTTIDTAEIYGGYRVEEVLGQAIALSPGLRDKLEIVTKAGIYIPTSRHPDRRAAHYDASRGKLIASVECSLNLLGTDQIDLFLVHRADWLTSIDDTADGLNALVKSGKVRSVGVSNYSAGQFAALNSRMDTGLVTNQVEFGLLQMDPVFDGTFDQAQMLTFRPMVRSPLAGGRLFAVGDPAADRIRAAATAMLTRYPGATLEQIAYAWVMAHPSRPIPVIGTNKIDRIETSAVAAALRLEREDWFALWVAAKGHGIP